MTEEKPQKADLRAKVERIIRGLRIDGMPNSAELLEEYIALIDADSKAREEEKKRLADKLRFLYKYTGMSSFQRENIEAIIQAELTASNQDSEGTG